MAIASQRTTTGKSPGTRWGVRRIERTSLAGHVYEPLRAALMMGELKPGERLNCRVIAEECGVSQTPAREALLRLVAERALVINPNRAVTVPRLTRAEYRELRDIRVALEGLASRIAAANATPEQVSELEMLNRKMIAAEKKGDYRTTLRVHRDFHFAVYRMSGRQELLAMIESLWIRTGPYLNLLYTSEKFHPADVEPNPHAVLISALRLRDGAKAAEAITDDLVRFGEIILSALDMP
jgi:GntR family transcriptional regulator, colanic acid and biofilm gene transcriptional regulator